MKTLTTFKRTIQAGKRWYSYYDACAFKRDAVKLQKKMRAKGYNAIIRKFKVPHTGGTTYHVFTCRRK